MYDVSSKNVSNTTWLYFIECRGSRIYTGITDDIDRRWKQHQQGRGSLFTKLNPPVRILGKIAFQTRAAAAQEERRLKRLEPVERRAEINRMLGLREDEAVQLNIRPRRRDVDKARDVAEGVEKMLTSLGAVVSEDDA